jgi:RNA polymerase sigma factor (sigma-70 family)
MMNDDMVLIQEFAASESESAFATLVSRYIPLVHTAALRQVGDAHLAQDVTQAVFIILARKAGSLGPNTILSAWLYRTTGYVASETRRTRRRRAQREQEVYMQSTLNDEPAGEWHQLSPLLDEAMASLSERDRCALVLRFFENKAASEIAVALKVSEEAAQKRVTRALERLKNAFRKRGVLSTTAAIAGAVSANSVLAVPPALTELVAVAAMTQNTAVGGTTLTLVKGALKLMAWAKAKLAITAAVASLCAVCLTGMAIQSVMGQAGGAGGTLAPGTFITAWGAYQWRNPSSVGKLTFQDNRTKMFTVGTSAAAAAGAVVVDQWTNPVSRSELVIQSNLVRFVTAAGQNSSVRIDINTWNPSPDWFVYRASGMRVWAFDGDRGLWMMTITPRGGESVPIDSLEEPPPAAVLKRLPDKVKKLLPPRG